MVFLVRISPGLVPNWASFRWPGLAWDHCWCVFLAVNSFMSVNIIDWYEHLWCCLEVGLGNLGWGGVVGDFFGVKFD